MKTFTKCLLAVFTFGMVTHYAIAQSQISFSRLCRREKELPAGMPTEADLNRQLPVT